MKLRRLAGGVLVFAAGSAGCAGVAMAVGPEIPSPSVQAPSTPSVPTVPSLPSLPSVPGVPSLPPAPTVRPPVAVPPATAPVPDAGSTAPALTGGSGAPGAAVGVTGGAKTAIGSATPSSAAAGQARARTSRGAAQRRARERSFRRDVRRHSSCFYVLSGFERRVLALRAGLRGTQPHSRRYVARRLRTSALTIGRSERLALKSLRGADDADGCAESSDSLLTGFGIVVRVVANTVFSPVLASVADRASDGLLADATADDRGGVAGMTRSGGGQVKNNTSDDRAPDTAGIALPSSGTTSAPDDGPNGALIAAFFALAALLMAATLTSRRHRIHNQADRWPEGPTTLAPWTPPEQAPAKEDGNSEQKLEPRQMHGSPGARKGGARTRTRTRNRR